MSTATKEQKAQWRRADEEVRKNLPPGVKLVRTLRGHTGEIGRIAWSPDGWLLASPSEDGTIRLWDAETGECLQTLEGHQGLVYCTAFAPRGDRLASGGVDHTVRVWDILNEKPIASLDQYRGPVGAVAFHPNGRTLAGGGGGPGIMFWRTDREEECHPISDTALPHDRSNVFCLDFNASGTALAWAGDKEAKLIGPEEQVIQKRGSPLNASVPYRL